MTHEKNEELQDYYEMVESYMRAVELEQIERLKEWLERNGYMDLTHDKT